MDALRPEEIEARELVGWLGGCPVYRISTTGGYNLVLVMRNGRLEPLGAGAVEGIAKGIAQKREPTIRWTQLAKSDVDHDPSSQLFRHYEAATSALRASMGFAP